MLLTNSNEHKQLGTQQKAVANSQSTNTVALPAVPVLQQQEKEELTQEVSIQKKEAAQFASDENTNRQLKPFQLKPESTTAQNFGHSFQSANSFVLQRMNDGKEDDKGEEEDVNWFKNPALENKIFEDGESVVMIGENHGETMQILEKAYFEDKGNNYHTETSSYTQTYNEAEEGVLSVSLDADDFSVENVPMRTLSHVYDLITYQQMYQQKFYTPVQHFYVDCYSPLDKLTHLKNEKMIAKEKAKLAKAKKEFDEITKDKIYEDASLYVNSMLEIVDHMQHTLEALTDTSWKGKVEALHAQFVEVMNFYEPFNDEKDNFININSLDDLGILEEAVKGLGEIHQRMPEIAIAAKNLLIEITAKQERGASQVPNAGTNNDDAVTKSRSEAMLNNANWLAENTDEYHVIKVGDAHISDMNGVDFDSDNLRIIAKDDYYQMQDETGTDKLRDLDD